MANYRVCTERIPKANGPFWLLGWKWEWWLEDDRQDGYWGQTHHDPWKRFGFGEHRSRSKENAICEGQKAIAYIRKEEAKKLRIAEARASTHECIPE